MEREIEGWSRATLLQLLYQSVVVKKALSWKAKLSIYWSIYVPTYGHELWIVTKRTWSRIEAGKISFPCRVAERSHRDRVRSSVIQEELRAELLLFSIDPPPSGDVSNMSLHPEWLCRSAGLGILWNRPWRAGGSVTWSLDKRTKINGWMEVLFLFYIVLCWNVNKCFYNLLFDLFIYSMKQC